MRGETPTSREVVLAKHPSAVARCVQGHAHAAESYERQAHWEICSGSGESDPLLGVGSCEQHAWADSARSLQSGLGQEG
jgi:hypothetical protein